MRFGGERRPSGAPRKSELLLHLFENGADPVPIDRPAHGGDRLDPHRCGRLVNVRRTREHGDVGLRPTPADGPEKFHSILSRGAELCEDEVERLLLEAVEPLPSGPGGDGGVAQLDEEVRQSPAGTTVVVHDEQSHNPEPPVSKIRTLPSPNADLYVP